jgi:hypothetical protein
MIDRVVSTLWLLTAAGCVAVVILTTTITDPLPPLPIDPFWLAWVGLPVVGAFILAKRPGNRVGAIVLAIGVCAALSGGSKLAAVYGWGSTDYMAVINQLAFAPLFVLLPLLVLVFPDGDLPSSRWRGPVFAAFVLDAVLVVWFAVRPVEYSFDGEVYYANPLGIESLAVYDGVVISVLQWTLSAFVLAVLVNAIRQYRRATVQERLQVKWVIAPALIAPVFFLVGIFIEEVSPGLGNVSVMAAIVGGGNGMAAGIGVAILQHRLYGIDRVISRTVSYLLVVALLALVVLGLISSFAVFLPSDDPLVVAVATLAVFALFTPVRRRVQAAVERRFNRSRYDAARVVDDFTGQLQERVDPEGVLGDWVEIVEETMQPTAVGVWVKP